MTDKEKAIVMAYTGIAMLIGDKFDIFHKYVEEIMCRPVFTHELAICAEEIKEKAKPDFLKLCAEEEQTRPHGEWKIDTKIYCSECGESICDFIPNPNDAVVLILNNKFCFNCGADMRKEGDQK